MFSWNLVASSLPYAKAHGYFFFLRKNIRCEAPLSGPQGPYQA